jgi:hypothetical protein
MMNASEINEKVIDKIRKLHAKAESCDKIGNQEEAEVFAAAVNRLLLKHNLSMSEVEWEKREVDDKIEKVWVDFEAVGIKAKKARQEWSEQLGMIIARAHFCKILIRHGTNHLCFVGHHSDREVAEYLFVAMYRLAEQMSERAYVKYFYECRAQGDVSRARGFRSGWLTGFIRGLSTRFENERKIVAPTGSTALVRIDRSLVKIEEWMKQNQKTTPAARLHQLRHHDEGTRRGRQAAEDINLRANALRAGQKSQGRLT